MANYNPLAHLPAAGALALSLGLTSTSSLAAVRTDQLLSEHPVLQRVLAESPMAVDEDSPLAVANDYSKCHSKTHEKTNDYSKSFSKEGDCGVAQAVAVDLDVAASTLVARLLA